MSEDSGIQPEVGTQGRKRHSIKWGDIPNWASAICTVLLTVIAIWTIFFSPASEALVSYLQSELALRNTRIATLEVQEQELQSQVEQRETQLSELEGAISQLAREEQERETNLQHLTEERQRLTEATAELSEGLERAQLLYARERVYVSLTEGLIMANVINLTRSYYVDGHVPAASENVYARFLDKAERFQQTLVGDEASNVEAVLVRFRTECGTLINNVLRIPDIQAPGEDLEYSLRQDAHDANAETIRLVHKQMFDMQDEVLSCLMRMEF